MNRRGESRLLIYLILRRGNELFLNERSIMPCKTLRLDVAVARINQERPAGKGEGLSSLKLKIIVTPNKEPNCSAALCTYVPESKYENEPLIHLFM